MWKEIPKYCLPFHWCQWMPPVKDIVKGTDGNKCNLKFLRSISDWNIFHFPHFLKSKKIKIYTGLVQKNSMYIIFTRQNDINSSAKSETIRQYLRPDSQMSENKWLQGKKPHVMLLNLVQYNSASINRSVTAYFRS